MWRGLPRSKAGSQSRRGILQGCGKQNAGYVLCSVYSIMHGAHRIGVRAVVHLVHPRMRGNRCAWWNVLVTMAWSMPIAIARGLASARMSRGGLIHGERDVRSMWIISIALLLEDTDLAGCFGGAASVVTHIWGTMQHLRAAVVEVDSLSTTDQLRAGCAAMLKLGQTLMEMDGMIASQLQ